MHLCSACNRRTTNALSDDDDDEVYEMEFGLSLYTSYPVSALFHLLSISLVFSVGAFWLQQNEARETNII